MSNLKLCPNCGNNPELVYSNDTYVVCRTCKMRGPGVYGHRDVDHIAREAVIKGWNDLPRG